MKYETVKTTVARSVHTAILNDYRGAGVAALMDSVAENRSTYTSQKALADKCHDIVMVWDVRLVGKLRELFPEWFPKALMKGPLVAGYDDKGEWIVEVQPRT